MRRLLTLGILCVAASGQNRFLDPDDTVLVRITPEQEQALFGVRGARGTDGLHLRGSRGQQLHTAAVITAIQACGLGGQGPARVGRKSLPSGHRAAAGWQVVGGRRAARQGAGQEPARPAVPTTNYYGPLGN